MPVSRIFLLLTGGGFDTKGYFIFYHAFIAPYLPNAAKRTSGPHVQFDAAMQSVNSAQFQVDLWKKEVDVYTDRMYWRHSVSGKITFDRPGLQHYLPPNFSIPLPPEDLPPDVPLETSSSSSGGSDGAYIWGK